MTLVTEEVMYATTATPQAIQIPESTLPQGPGSSLWELLPVMVIDITW